MESYFYFVGSLYYTYQLACLVADGLRKNVMTNATEKPLDFFASIADQFLTDIKNK